MSNSKNNYLFPLIVMASLFFLFGFITTMSNSLIDFLKGSFNLTSAQAGIVNAAFYGAYIISIPVGYLIGKTGYKKGIVIGMVLITIGFLLFIKAVDIGYVAFLCALFVVATGVVILQVAANPYILALGSAETAASRLTLTQALNSLATFFAPIFVTFVILAGATNATAVIVPFIGIAVVTLVLGIIIYFLKLPEIKSHEAEVIAGETAKTSVWQFKHLIFGTIAIGIYMGIEMTIPSFLPGYIKLINPEFLETIKTYKIVELLAKGKPEIFMISLYWGGMMIGRFVGAGILNKFSPAKVLALFAIIAAVLIFISLISSGSVAMWAIILPGLFHSIMWPVIFGLATDGLGKFAKQGSGILCTAVIFTGMWTIIQGGISDSFSIKDAAGILIPTIKSYQWLFMTTFIFYAYIIFFALKGSKMR